MKNIDILNTNEKKESSKKSKANKKQIYKLTPYSINFILLNIIALFVSRVFIIDKLFPFSLAIVAAFLNKGKLSFWVTLSTSLGLMSVTGNNRYAYIISAWILLIAYRYISTKTKLTILKISTLSAIVLIIIKSALLIKTNYLLYDFTLIIFESIIVFSLTFIFNYSSNVLDSKHKKVYTNEEIISISIVISLAIAGIRDLSILSLVLRDIIGVFLVILFSYYKGVTMATTIGITIGLITSISTSDITIVISIYAISGLLSGLFKELGKVGVSLGFMVGTLMMTFYINGLTELIIGIKEIVVASIIFIIVSKYITKSSNTFIKGLLNDLETDGINNNRIKDMIHKRLEEFSNVFEELSITFKKVAEKEKPLEQKDISQFVDKIANEVCSGCPMYRVCWENDFYTTYNSMFELMSVIEHNGKISESTLPNSLKKRCIRHNILMNKSNYIFDIYKLNYKWERKISESRQIVSQQLEGVSSIIRGLSNEVLNEIKFKEDVEKNIWNELKNQNIDVKEVTVFEDDKKKFEIYIDIKKNYNEDYVLEKIINIASNTVGCALISEKLFSNKNRDKDRIRFKLIKANRFGAITKIARSDDSFSYVSGDSYTFGERYNDYFVVLSDGMGVGHKANEESSIVISLLEKFLEAGFDKEIALKTINSMLVLRSDDEMFATIDMSIIDLFRGKSKFIKIGSAPTFIKKKKEVKIINSNSLPIGILQDVDVTSHEEQLENGDLVITMSDGVLDCYDDEFNKEKWMKSLIENIDSINPQRIADKIIDEALSVSKTDKTDDMTVLVTKIWKTK